MVASYYNYYMSSIRLEEEKLHSLYSSYIKALSHHDAYSEGTTSAAFQVSNQDSCLRGAAISEILLIFVLIRRIGNVKMRTMLRYGNY